MPVNTLSQSRLKKLIEYDSITGEFVWRINHGRWNRIKAGTKAGWIHGKLGYQRINIDGKYYYLHRLAFLYMTGTYPSTDIDHINHDTLDNRWSNLRLVDNSVNAKNMALPKNNKSGFIGIHWYKPRNKWMAFGTSNGIRKTIGYFDDIESAISARQAFNEKHDFHENHGSLFVRKNPMPK